MPTDTTEKGIETLIMRHMTGVDGLAASPRVAADLPLRYEDAAYIAGNPKDFDRPHALDVLPLFSFLRATQPDTFKKLAMADANRSEERRVGKECA